MTQPTPPSTPAAASASAANPTAEVDVQTAETAASSRRLKKKLIIGAVIAGVVLAESVVIYMVMPHSAPSAAAPEAESDDSAHKDNAEHGKPDASSHSKEHGKKGEEGTSTPPKSGGSTEEADLGEFSVTSYQPASNTTLFISFHLFGTHLHKNSDDFSHRLNDNKHRIRDNIIIIIRSAEITDLTDPGLGLIKRRILETTNKTLGKPLLQAVVFSDFSLVEQ